MSDSQIILLTMLFTLFIVLVCQYFMKKFGVSRKISHSLSNANSFDHKEFVKDKSYEQLVEVIDEYEKHQETGEQQKLIAELKRKMKEMMGQVDSYEDRVMVATYCIENIFNVLNNKKTISFDEFYKILSKQIVTSKSVDPAFKSYVKNRKSGGRFF